MMSRKIKADESLNRKNGKRILLIAVALLMLIGAHHILRQKADDFRDITAENVERLHAEIRAERYREIGLSNDRRLIVNQDQAELTAMLRQANYFLAQTPRIDCPPPRFDDVANRLWQRVGRPFEIYNSCRLTSATGATATELFVWRDNRSGGGLKLAYYELNVR